MVQTVLSTPLTSLVAARANDTEDQDRAKAIPKENDARKLNLFGRKFYSTVGLQLHIASHQALLACYDYPN